MVIMVFILVLAMLIPMAIPVTAVDVQTFTVNASVAGEHGSVDPVAQTVNNGDSATINITPDTGYQIDNITDNNDPVAIANPYVIDNITINHDVIVTFAPIQTFTVNASIAGEHGSVDPVAQTVNNGDSATINITPDTGYQIDNITDNNDPVAIANPYVIDGITTNHDVVITLAPVEIDNVILIVRLVAGLNPDNQQLVIARNGGKIIRSIPVLRMYFIEASQADMDETIQRYQSDPHVLSIETDKVRQVEGTPSDLSYPDQWALPQIGWDSVFGTVTPTGSSVIAILDTGIDSSHPDLTGLILPGYSAFEESDARTDPNGHGTRVAGIAVALTDNELGVSGVAYAGVSLLPVQVLGADGTGQDSDIINGIVWASENGADVILMAFSNPDFSPALQAAIDYAWDNGIILIAAVGNDGSGTATYPAGDRGVIGVSATDQNDALTDGSNYGQTVFLAAPGLDILTTDLNGAYTRITGTSASAAIVAGAAALMRAIDPNLSNGIIVNRLALTADPAGTQEQTGNGRLNLESAVNDESTDFIQPAGVPPLGNGGPFVGPYLVAAAKTASVSGNWSSTATWGGAAVPVAVDTVTINTGVTVTVDIATAVCKSLNLGTTNGIATLTFASSGSPKLIVSGAVTVGNSGNANRRGTITFTSGSTMITGSMLLGTTGAQTSTIVMTNGGTLQVGGAITTASTGATFTSGTGTVVLTANNTLPNTIFTSFNNLSITGGTTTLGVATNVTGNLTIGSGAILSTNNWALTLRGNFTLGGTFSAGSSAIIIGPGTATQTIDSFTTTGAVSMTKTGGTATFTGNVNGGSLTINGSGGTLNLGSGLTHTFTGVVTLTAGILNGSSSTLNLSGNWTGTSGTFVSQSGTVALNGTSAQQMSGATTFTNLTINNSAGIALSSNETINGTLALTSGRITTGNNKVIIPASGNVSRGTGYVIGSLQKNVAAGATTLTFEIGSANYNPVTLNFNNVATAGDLTAQVTAGQHPNIGSCLIGSWRDVNVYWTLTGPGITFNSFNATFDFSSGDITGGNPSNYSVANYSSGWFYPTTSTRTSTSTQAIGITSFNDFVVGEKNTPPTLVLTTPDSMTPQQQWTQITATVSDPDTLADVQEVKIVLFYDSNKSHPASAPTSGNPQTCAILIWTRSGGWSIDQGTGTTWALNTGGCSKPSDSLTSGDWVFSFKVGKVATNTTSTSGWDVYAVVTDSAATTGTAHKYDIAMAWYGEVTVTTVTINWGTVNMSSDFAANVQTGIIVGYICNGNYQEQVMTTSPWVHNSETVRLNNSGTPGNGEFSLRANATNDLGGSQFVNSTSRTSIGTGTQTGESGVTINTNTLWLKVGIGISPGQFTGIIYYTISP
jgi:subtilisin family serine protease